MFIAAFKSPEAQVPLLSIGIPVHNGERAIRRTLYSIIAQVPKQDYGDLEIVISDNASSDETRKIPAEYTQRFLGITLICNQENLGFDRNVDTVVERARGKYVWLLGCGEIVEQDATRRIRSVLIGSDFSNLLYNFLIYAESKKGVVETNALSVSRNEAVDDVDHLFSKYASPFMAVSSNIVRRSEWLSAMKFPLIESGWVHVERILRMLMTSGGRLLIVSTHCFVMYREEHGWWTRQDVFFIFIKYDRILNTLFQDSARACIERAIRKNASYSLWASIDAEKWKIIRLTWETMAQVSSVSRILGFRWLVVRSLAQLPYRLFARHAIELYVDDTLWANKDCKQLCALQEATT